MYKQAMLWNFSKELTEDKIQDALTYYREKYGEPGPVWANPEQAEGFDVKTSHTVPVQHLMVEHT